MLEISRWVGERGFVLKEMRMTRFRSALTKICATIEDGYNLISATSPSRMTVRLLALLVVLLGAVNASRLKSEDGKVGPARFCSCLCVTRASVTPSDFICLFVCLLFAFGSAAATTLNSLMIATWGARNFASSGLRAKEGQCSNHTHPFPQVVVLDSTDFELKLDTVDENGTNTRISMMGLSQAIADAMVQGNSCSPLFFYPF
jgi:hypothetical protein